jgi:hypothetical protein
VRCSPEMARASAFDLRPVDDDHGHVHDEKHGSTLNSRPCVRRQAQGDHLTADKATAGPPKPC